MVLFVTTYSNGCGLVFENVTIEGDTLLVKLNYPEDIRSREEIVCTEIAIPQTFVVKMEKAGVDKDIKVKDWNDDQIAAIRGKIASEFKIEGELRSSVQMNIKRLMDIGCYRGIRHRIGLPVRGQSTKNNARTRKGRKKTVANKKKATK